MAKLATSGGLDVNRPPTPSRKPGLLTELGHRMAVKLEPRHATPPHGVYVLLVLTYANEELYIYYSTNTDIRTKTEYSLESS